MVAVKEHQQIFNTQGYDAVGVDISKKNIKITKNRFPSISDKFKVIDSLPHLNNYYGFKENIDLVYALQSLYYFTKKIFIYVLKKSIHL